MGNSTGGVLLVGSSYQPANAYSAKGKAPDHETRTPRPHSPVPRPARRLWTNHHCRAEHRHRRRPDRRRPGARRNCRAHRVRRNRCADGGHSSLDRGANPAARHFAKLHSAWRRADRHRRSGRRGRPGALRARPAGGQRAQHRAQARRGCRQRDLHPQPRWRRIFGYDFSGGGQTISERRVLNGDEGGVYVVALEGNAAYTLSVAAPLQQDGGTPGDAGDSEEAAEELALGAAEPVSGQLAA